MHTNRLIHEKSPYLLQHAHNPVDWYPWGDEAFEKARREDKPIFLSIGYSTCHWCHVMERESFEDEGMAKILNRYFVPVKVDREERPDVDRIYMMFVQATTGGGGWPLSVWLTPQLKPFFGGTYFPPENRYGRPGFATVLEHLARAWITERDRVLRSGDEILAQLRQFADVAAGTSRLDPAALDSGFYSFRRSFDPRLGGFGGAPKFPRPSVLNFLFRYSHRSGNDEAAEMALTTLDRMARGGMNDQLGGGFHRYSVDARWFVPHFEKMLYDQAQLAQSFLEGYLISGEPRHAETARQIFDYVLRDMTHPEGGFYSAEDADSVIDPAEPARKGEGAFYIWTRREIESLLGQPVAQWFNAMYGVEANGNVHEDPHQEFTGRNILAMVRTAEEVARLFDTDAGTVAAAMAGARETLLAARGRRVRPHLDDKILTAWNGLMISALAKGAQVLPGGDRYLKAAQRATRFLMDRLYDPATGLLRRRYRDGEAAIDGFLDDYAFLGCALVDLYETDFDVAHLKLSVRLAETMRALFEDSQQGAFFSTGDGKGDLLMRLKEDYDGAEPSGNSLAVMLLLRLAGITGRQDFRDAAQRALEAFAPRLNQASAVMPQMLCAYMLSISAQQQVIVAGHAPELLEVVRRQFHPNRTVLAVNSSEAREVLAAWQPSVAAMGTVDGKPAVYVCENFTCQLPATDAAQLQARLQAA